MIDPPHPDAAQQVSRILCAVEGGQREASADLLPLVYEDLRKLAAARMARLGSGQTLQATALVHEAYLRLVGAANSSWESRAHFFGAAARAMRDIVADHLQKKGSLKRGGNLKRAGAETMAALTSEGPSDDIMAVEEALQVFQLEYPRKAEVVTLTFFGGLTAKESAEVLSVSPRTVEGDWRFAKAWLNSWLSERNEA